MTALAAFDPQVTAINTLTGGVNSIDRALVLGQGQAQTAAARSIGALFTNRLNEARAALAAGASSPLIDSLARQQSLLVSRQERVNEALAVLNQADTQITYIKGWIERLRDSVDSYEASDITASELITEWDNAIRKINELSDAGAQTYFDAGVYYEKNLIGSNSRTSFGTQVLLAPYDSTNNTLQIDGIYLGTDYYITEDGSGDVFLSDAGFRASEDDTATIYEYSSYPDTLTGVSTATSNITVNSFDTSTGTIQFTSGDTGTIDGTVTRGGLKLLDSFLYQSAGAGTFDATAAESDLDEAESILLLAEAEFDLSRRTLETRATVFASAITGLEREIQEQLEDINSEKEADLLSAELDYSVAQLNFALLASRGNTLILSLINSQDAQEDKDNIASGKLIAGAVYSETA